MTITEVFAPALPDTVSAAMTALVERVSPSVVQVQSRGRGHGAGIIWRASGAIMTNYHVVANDGRGLQVQLRDGRSFDATVVAGNPALDLALIEVKATDLPAAPIADASGLRVGEMVFAIGHPWGQRGVVTAGIISGLGTVAAERNAWQAQYIRSDVRLAPGNSGGPLLNARGEVIGINAMIFGGDLAVAIPSHVAQRWLNELPRRAVFLGVSVQAVELPQAARQEPGTAQAQGLLVVGVAPGSPAEGAGLLLGDVLLDVAGAAVEDGGALIAALTRQQPGDTINLRILRGGLVQRIDVVLGATETADGGR